MGYQYIPLTYGQVVQVRKGRDAGSWAVVVDIDRTGFVWIADGKRRPVERPKKKNIKHVQPTKYIAADIQGACRRGEKVSDAQLRYALNQYLLRFQECKGE